MTNRVAIVASVAAGMLVASFASAMERVDASVRLNRADAIRKSSVSNQGGAEAVSLFATGFETSGAAYTSGSSLTAAANGWNRDGSGAATVLVNAGLARNGANTATFTPNASGSWVYRTDTAHSGANLAANPVVASSASLRITSPASGTATRGAVYSLQAYTSAVNLIADFTLVWDADASLVTGGAAGDYYLFQDWFHDTGDTTGDGVGYLLGNFTSAQLANSGWLDLSLALNYATGDIAFTVNGVTDATHGTFDPASFTDFSDADFFYSRATTGTTLPRLLGDDYSVVASNVVPEPTSLISLASLALGTRRRRA